MNNKFRGFYCRFILVHLGHLGTRFSEGVSVNQECWQQGYAVGPGMRICVLCFITWGQRKNSCLLSASDVWCQILMIAGVHARSLNFQCHFSCKDEPTTSYYIILHHQKAFRLSQRCDMIYCMRLASTSWSARSVIWLRKQLTQRRRDRIRGSSNGTGLVVADHNISTYIISMNVFSFTYRIRRGAHVVDGCRLMVLLCRSYPSRVEP